jgi:N-acetylmuramoyl-L-alanine amidase
MVVDVGHTAEVPGAISSRGVPEYEFNHRLAKLIVQRLTESGFARTVLLVTADPPKRGLFQRVRHANEIPAHLFLSIHHDSVPNALLEKWDHNGTERRFSDRFKGHSLFISHDNPERNGSLLFAKLLGKELKARGLQYTPHYTEPIMGGRRRELLDAETGVYRYDQLVVLRGSRMPAVLLEAGSIINREEELLMAAPERQALIAAAVLDAVESFCARKGR